MTRAHFDMGMTAHFDIVPMGEIMFVPLGVMSMIGICDNLRRKRDLQGHPETIPPITYSRRKILIMAMIMIRMVVTGGDVPSY